MSECDKCGKDFRDKYDRYAHGECVPEESYRKYAMKRDELISDVSIPNSNRCIYVLLVVRNSDGKEFYYVGETTDIEKRTHNHVRDDDIRMISEDERSFTEDYIIKEIVEIEELGDVSKSIATYKERQKAMELAIAHDTTDILGGR